MDRPRAAWVAVLSVLLLVSGCLRPVPPPPATPTTVSFAFWAVTPAETALYHQLAAEFATTYPQYRVDVREIPNRYYDKLQTLFAAGTPPDVLVANYGRLADLARRGVLAEVSPRPPEAGLTVDQLFLPRAVQSFRVLGERVGRPGLYGLPLDWGPANLLVYDREALAAAGLQPPWEAWTWAQWASAARRLTVRATDPAQRRYGAGVCLYPYGALAWLYQGGGGLVSADGRHSALDSPANRRTLTFLTGLAREGVIAPLNPAEDRSLEEFRQGRLAMAFVTPYVLGELRAHPGGRDWAIAPPLTGERTTTSGLPTAVAVAAPSRHLEAARQLAWFLATRGAAARARAGLGVPAWLPALQSEAMGKGFGEQAAEVLRRAAPQAQPPPVSAQTSYEQMIALMRETLERITGEGLPVAQALREGHTRLERQLHPGSSHP